MQTYPVNLTHNELYFIRQALDLPTISGKDAKFLVNLQMKVEQYLANIEQLKLEAEKKKAKELQETLSYEQSIEQQKK